MVNTEVKVGQIYRHYKGKHYQIVAVGRFTESDKLEECVVYKGLYDDAQFGKNPIWIRPLTMFIEDIEVNGETIPRFAEIKS